MLTSSNVDRFSGYANLYDRYRPTPPDILSEILIKLIQTPYPRLVVDLGSGTGLSTQYWEKKCFRYTKEIVVHHTDLGNTERFVGIALSQGSVQTLLKTGYSEADIGIEQLRQIADTELGPQPNPWYWASRVRIGIK
jgi:hypothetical protein